MGVGVVAVLRLAVHGRRNVGGSGEPVSHSARRNDRDNIVVVAVYQYSMLYFELQTELVLLACLGTFESSTSTSPTNFSSPRPHTPSTYSPRCLKTNTSSASQSNMVAVSTMRNAPESAPPAKATKPPKMPKIYEVCAQSSTSRSATRRRSR